MKEFFEKNYLKKSELAPGPCFFIKSICLIDMNMFARIEEIPTRTLQDIKATKRHSRICVPFRITNGNNSNKIGPGPYFFIKRHRELIIYPIDPQW